MLILALQYWSGDYKDAMAFARFATQLEKEPRKDVEFWFVPRFDAPEPDREVVSFVKTRFAVKTYRSTRRGQGHPSGCNDLWHSLMLEVYRRCLQEKFFAQKYTGVYSIEADNVPLSRDWLDRVLAEWAEARHEGKLVLGCRMEEPTPHINGNLVFVPDLFGRIKGLEGCPAQIAWDIFHAAKWMGLSKASAQIVNFYKATKVPKNRLYADKNRPKYAVVHGVKDSSVLDAAKKAIFGAEAA